MKKTERQKIILEELKKNTVFNSTHLAKELSISTVTLRHDLDELAAKGLLIRSHGGAILPTQHRQKNINIPVPRPSDISNFSLKQAIAREAIKLIADDDTIFIGCGSTFYVLAQQLKTYHHLKIVTNNLNVAYELASSAESVYFIGGELVEMDGIYNTSGPKIPLELEKVYVNKAFIGVSGIDMRAGLTIFDLTQLSMYTTIKKVAQELILVCDKTKFDIQSAHQLGSIGEYASTIITNEGIRPLYRSVLENMGIHLITVRSE